MDSFLVCTCPRGDLAVDTSFSFPLNASYCPLPWSLRASSIGGQSAIPFPSVPGTHVNHQEAELLSRPWASLTSASSATRPSHFDTLCFLLICLNVKPGISRPGLQLFMFFSIDIHYMIKVGYMALVDVFHAFKYFLCF